jgi:hypothetical protein
VRFDSRRCECKKLNIVAANALDDFCNGVEGGSHGQSADIGCNNAVLGVSTADEETGEGHESDDSRDSHWLIIQIMRTIPNMGRENLMNGDVSNGMGFWDVVSRRRGAMARTTASSG